MKTIGTWARNYGLQLGILLAVVIYLSFAAPQFTGQAAVYSTLERLVLLGIITAGISLTMIARELDLSVGTMAVLSGVIAVQLSDVGPLIGILAGTFTGLALGLLQGWIISRIKINSLVFTVGTMLVWGALAWILAGGRPVTVGNYELTDALVARFWVFSPLSIVAVLVLIATGVFLTWTQWGREIYAVGAARDEAAAAGVRIPRALIIAFGFSGFCAALAGSLASMKGGSVSPDSYSGILLSAVAAALIGGVSLYGGRGNIISIVLGALIIASLTAGLSSAAVRSFVSESLIGVLLLVVIVVEFVIGRVSARRRLAELRSEGVS